jgi:hypothetical protein
LPIENLMGPWPTALLPRIAIFVAIGLSLTATLTYAAEKQLTAPNPAAATAAAPAAEVIVVPEVRGQAYVFAEGILEDNGFSWRVPGGNGYAANSVVGQSPLPGTRVVDTGAPLVTLVLSKNSTYPQRGTPVNASPFPATDMRLPAANALLTPLQEGATPAPAAPAATPKPAAAPKPVATPKPAAKPVVRTPDFIVPGAPKEPAKEMPLVKRAELLNVFLTKHKVKSSAAVRHWMYQHEWIVTGAKFGWWHGAEALQVLVQADRRVQQLWGIGSPNEAVARAALAEVQAKAK